MDKIQLDFSRFTISELLKTITETKIPDWFLPAVDFLKSCQQSDEFTFMTSGTTGAPKELKFKRKQLSYSANLTLDFFKLKEGDHVLLPLSCNYVAGKMMLFRAIEGRLNLVCVRPSNNPILHLKNGDRFKFSPLVPLQLYTVLKSNTMEEVNKLGVLLLGGAALSMDLEGKLKDCGVEAWSSFGMTETLTHFALKQINPINHNSYKCIGDYKIRTDSDGSLIVKNDKMFLKELYCNDVIELIDEKQFKWLGRKDNVVNSGGVKFYPEMIEEQIRKLLSAEISFVLIGVTDEKLGQRLVFVAENSRVLTSSEYLILKENLPEFQFPKEFKTVECFERTASGKIKRRALLSLLS